MSGRLPPFQCSTRKRYGKLVSPYTRVFSPKLGTTNLPRKCTCFFKMYGFHFSPNFVSSSGIHAVKSVWSKQYELTVRGGRVRLFGRKFKKPSKRLPRLNLGTRGFRFEEIYFAALLFFVKCFLRTPLCPRFPRPTNLEPVHLASDLASPCIPCVSCILPPPPIPPPLTTL